MPTTKRSIKQPFDLSTSLTREERLQHGLLGSLPYRVETIEEEMTRAYQQYSSLPDKMAQNIFLHELCAINPKLFYRLVDKHIEEMLPIIYTPQVAEAVKQYSANFRKPRGLFIAYPDRDNIEEILNSVDSENVDIVIVTDSERILGIGDQGVGGIEIPIAKGMLYSLFAGIDPERILPVVLDVGTNNRELLDDPLYLGWRNERIRGDDYYAFIDQFITALQKRFSDVFLHWEDFGRDNAGRNLRLYRKKICSFNDDIQGTAVVTVAALLNALKKTGQKLDSQRFVVFGAGSAGMGICHMLVMAMKKTGISEKKCYEHFWLIDRDGLLTEGSVGVTNEQKKYLRPSGELAGDSLQEVVSQVKPTILIGCSGVKGAFTKEIIEKLAEHVQNPIIFPLSNPQENCEADPNDLLNWTSGKALVATGSPFPNVSQCNNALAFPGIGLAVMTIKPAVVTDEMLWTAASALLDYSLSLILDNKLLLPRMSKAKEAAKFIASAIIKAQQKDNLQFADNSVFLGFDFGTSYIGIASGQKITCTASEVGTIKANNGIPNWQELDKIVDSWRPAALVAGVPIDLDGTEHWMTKAARKFIVSLKNRYNLPVYSVNEQLTTKAAREKIFTSGGYRALKKEAVDSLAAKLILEDWLNKQ